MLRTVLCQFSFKQLRTVSPLYLQNTQRTVLTTLPSKYSELSLPVYLQNTQNCSLLFTFKILRTVPFSLPSKYSELSPPVYLQNTQNSLHLSFSFEHLRTVYSSLPSKYSELSSPVFLQTTQNRPHHFTFKILRTVYTCPFPSSNSELSPPIYLQHTQKCLLQFTFKRHNFLFPSHTTNALERLKWLFLSFFFLFLFSFLFFLLKTRFVTDSYEQFNKCPRGFIQLNENPLCFHHFIEMQKKVLQKKNTKVCVLIIDPHFLGVVFRSYSFLVTVTGTTLPNSMLIFSLAQLKRVNFFTCSCC